MNIGILAVQGAFIEHEKILDQLHIQYTEIRKKENLKNIDGIILPGGESTVQGKLLRDLDLSDDIRNRISGGLPVLATCAGLILLSEYIENDPQTHLSTLPVTVKRNAYGRQTGSFAARGSIGSIHDFPMIFIRAPYITEVSPEVTVLAEVNSDIVGVKYKNQIGLAFHPEMTEDLRIHQAFVKLCKA